MTALATAGATTSGSPAVRSRRAARGRFTGAGMAAPFALLYLVFMIGPVVYNLVDSFFDTSLVKPGLGHFAGFGNFSEVLTTDEFWQTLGHTLWFTVLTTVPLVGLSLVFALVADRVGHGRWFFRVAFFAPYVLPVSVVALIFVWIYADRVGLLQQVFTAVGLTSPGWLSDPSWVLPSVAATTVWWTLGFNFILYLAALQDIPADVLEAASLDGAGPWQRIRHVVLPLLNRTTGLVTVLQVIASLKVFEQLYLIAGPGGGPNGSARSSIQYIYDSGFTDMRTGYASTVAFLLFVVVLLVSLVWLTVDRRVRGRR